MQKFILAVSPDTTLLMQIQAHLQEGGRFSVFCADSGNDALNIIKNQIFDLAILDGETNDLPFVLFTRELVALAPNLKLLVFSPQNNPKHPALTGLIANGFLNKPFFGPEVSEKISLAFDERNPVFPPVQGIEGDVTSTWLQNPEVGAQQIEQLLASTTASAALLLLRGQVLACSGVLPQESISNIINYLNRYWANIQSGELFRYLTMENEASSYIVYAAPLIRNTAISLVYQAPKSLPEIRAEVNRLKKAFLQRYSNTGELRQDFPFQSPGPSSEKELDPLTVQSRMITHSFSDTRVPESISSSTEEEDSEGEGLSEKELENLDNILSEMPPPDPEEDVNGSEISHADAAEWVSGTEPQPIGFTPVSSLPQVDRPVTINEIKTTPLLVTKPLPNEENGVFPDFDFKLPWESSFSKSVDVESVVSAGPPPLPIEGVDEISPTLQKPAYTALTSDVQNMQVPYTFILFRGNSGQFITRDLAKLCNQNLPAMIERLGWELNSISVRPLYMQWSAQIPMFCCIPEKLSDLRLQLNTQIFSTFPVLLKENPSGDFWLPGYFALSGSQPPSNRMINDFIALFRQTESQLQSI